MTEDLEREAFQALLKDPEELRKLIRKVAWEEFKEKHNLERATPLKCPACSESGFTGGTLWINKTEPNNFYCRKCHLEWHLQCLTMPTLELIEKMREAQK